MINRVALISYCALLTWLSLQPAQSQVIGSFDKLAHLLAYGVFAVLAFRLGLSRQRFALLCIAIIAYSAVLEFGQSFVPGRQMSALDLLANTLGVGLGALLCRRVAP